MQPSEFISLVSKPEKLNAENLQDIENIREKFPWFASSHVLLAKTHKNENRFSYQSLLKKAALYSTDREVLYNFMQTETFVKEAGVEEAGDRNFGESGNREIGESNKKETGEQEAGDRNLGESGNREIGESVKKETGEQETGDRSSGKSGNREIGESIKKETGEQEAGDRITFESDKEEPVSKDNLTGKSGNREIWESDNKEPVSKDNLTGKSGNREIRESDKKESGNQEIGESDKKEPKIIYNPLEELSKLIPDDEQEFEDHELIPLSVYDPEKELLMYLDSDEDADNESIEAKEEEINEESETELSTQSTTSSSEANSFLSWLDEVSEPEKKTVKPKLKNTKIKKKIEPKDDPQKLLDEFIAKRPTMRRMKKDFYNPQNMAEKSLQSNLGLVSETLAVLHLKQGRPQKAIEIYEQLKLQNPKNIAYFAARIQKIQTQIEKEND